MRSNGAPSRRHFLRTLGRWLAAGVLASAAQFAFADSEYAALWGPAIGADAPMLSASDQDGNAQTLETLSGSKGLVLVFNRSVNW